MGPYQTPPASQPAVRQMAINIQTAHVLSGTPFVYSPQTGMAFSRSTCSGRAIWERSALRREVSCRPPSEALFPRQGLWAARRILDFKQGSVAPWERFMRVVIQRCTYPRGRWIPGVHTTVPGRCLPVPPGPSNQYQPSLNKIPRRRYASQAIPMLYSRRSFSAAERDADSTTICTLFYGHL
ncbi:hypothetical protein C8Q77DRAFT_619616 [Trametes polyzona]|nr:hypothetical protein C8Q77DRAFT_619616 [Trametes polyzona]